MCHTMGFKGSNTTYNTRDVKTFAKHIKVINITPANLSILKNNKAKAIRFSTLEEICKALDCQPSDILEYVKE